MRGTIRGLDKGIYAKRREKRETSESMQRKIIENRKDVWVVGEISKGIRWGENREKVGRFRWD